MHRLHRNHAAVDGAQGTEQFATSLGAAQASKFMYPSGLAYRPGETVDTQQQVRRPRCPWHPACMRVSLTRGVLGCRGRVERSTPRCAPTAKPSIGVWSITPAAIPTPQVRTSKGTFLSGGSSPALTWLEDK